MAVSRAARACVRVRVVPARLVHVADVARSMTTSVIALVIECSIKLSPTTTRLIESGCSLRSQWVLGI